MREIKFRAWRDSMGFMMPTNSINELLALSASCGGLEADDEVVWMQFTGLTDKNGVEIYEGDILSPVHYQKVPFGNAAVEFKKGMFCFAINKPFIASTKPLTKSIGYGAKANNHFIVIGNIHENPELLCAKK